MLNQYLLLCFFDTGQQILQLDITNYHPNLPSQRKSNNYMSLRKCIKENKGKRFNVQKLFSS